MSYRANDLLDKWDAYKTIWSIWTHFRYCSDFVILILRQDTFDVVKRSILLWPCRKPRSGAKFCNSISSPTFLLYCPIFLSLFTFFLSFLFLFLLLSTNLKPLDNQMHVCNPKLSKWGNCIIVIFFPLIFTFSYQINITPRINVLLCIHLFNHWIKKLGNWWYNCFYYNVITYLCYTFYAIM